VPGDRTTADGEGGSGPEAMASQWANMADDGHFSQGAKGGSERILTQEEIDSLLGFSLADVSLNDNSGIRAIINSAILRAVADAGDHRPAGPVDDDVAAQFHFRQRRSLARLHHFCALRRLSQLDPAAGHSRRALVAADLLLGRVASLSDGDSSRFNEVAVEHA